MKVTTEASVFDTRKAHSFDVAHPAPPLEEGKIVLNLRVRYFMDRDHFYDVVSKRKRAKAIVNSCADYLHAFKANNS